LREILRAAALGAEDGRAFKVKVRSFLLAFVVRPIEYCCLTREEEELSAAALAAI